MGSYLSTNNSGQCGQCTKQSKNTEKEKIVKTIQKTVYQRLEGDVDKKTFLSQYSYLSEEEKEVIEADPADYDFPFTNLVFEGGGVKGVAFAGAVRALEELGLYSQIKRYAGASAGAMACGLFAVGYNSFEMEEIFGQNFEYILLDHQYGFLSLIPNLLNGYGWNPGNRFYEWYGDLLKKKIGSADITFSELYKIKKKELCIIVTNLNHMTEEYCHVKTTPNLPIRRAVRMSMSIPLLYRAETCTYRGETNSFVDGGLLCNYPIHCYDGWFLSMKSGDSFMEKLQPIEDLPCLLAKNDRFGSFNDETIGFLLYADSETDIYRAILDKRIGTQLPTEEIDSKLYREKQEKKLVHQKAKREHRHTMDAVNAFLKVIKRWNLDKNDVISRSELERAFDDPEFTEEHKRILFGEEISVSAVINVLDTDGNGEIQYHELMNFMETTGILLQQKFLGYNRKNIDGLFSFLGILQNTLLTNVKRVFVENRDLARTVGINTGHVDTTDFQLEIVDKKFAIEQGKRSTLAFLKYYIVNNPDKVKKKKKESEVSGIEENGYLN